MVYCVVHATRLCCHLGKCVRVHFRNPVPDLAVSSASAAMRKAIHRRNLLNSPAVTATISGI